MSTELTTTLADDILAAHHAAEEKVAAAKDNVEDAIRAKVECAAIVEAARSEMGNAAFWDFWREKVKLAKEEAQRYIGLHHAAKHRLIDKAQLRLIGIIDSPDQQEPQQRRTPDPFAWCKLVPKIRTQIDDDWLQHADPVQRATAKKTLEPLVELYNRL